MLYSNPKDWLWVENVSVWFSRSLGEGLQAEQSVMLQKNSDSACLLYHTASKFESQTSGEIYCLLFSDESPCSSRQDTVLLMRVGRDFSEMF